MLNRKFILLADDDTNFTKITSDLLRSHNCRVDIANSGKEVLEKIVQRPDVLLLDIVMEDMDGLEVCRIIRADKRLSSIPIIIISGLDTSKDKIEGLYMGADDYLTKPFNFEELIARIESVLRRNNFAEQNIEEKNALISELNGIIDNQQITPFFQPIYSFGPDQILGVEVLSRPPQQGNLGSPEILFKFAHSVGKYFDLEMLSWRKAIEKINASDYQGNLFFNCTPYLIEDDRFNKNFFTDLNISPERVVLEITERIAIQDYERFLGKVKDFKDQGLEIAIDDVGNGYASLDAIAEVKPDFIKIDMPLIRGINSDFIKQKIVHAIIQFGRDCHIKTVAEGIESRDELRTVKELKVNAGQGYFLNKPVQDIMSIKREIKGGDEDA